MFYGQVMRGWCIGILLCWNCLFSAGGFDDLFFQYLSGLRGEILIVPRTPTDPSEMEEFELELCPEFMNFTLRILDSDNPVFIIFAANSPNTTLGKTDFDLKFRERTDFESAGPPGGHKRESMRFQNRLQFFPVIPPVTTTRNHKLNRKPTCH
jgi:hypothetical protein